MCYPKYMIRMSKVSRFTRCLSGPSFNKFNKMRRIITYLSTFKTKIEIQNIEAIDCLDLFGKNRFGKN